MNHARIMKLISQDKRIMRIHYESVEGDCLTVRHGNDRLYLAYGQSGGFSSGDGTSVLLELFNDII